MGTFSIWHWLVVLAVVLILFGGRGKLSALMGDFGKGLKAFKKSVKEDDAAPPQEERKALESEAVTASEPAADEEGTEKG